MKVLHFLDSLNRGGAETLVLDVCRNAAAHNWQMTFVASGGGELEDEFKKSGVEFIRLQRNLPLDPRVILSLRRIIKEHDIRVVHAYQAVEGLHTYFAAKGTRAKKVLSFQGDVPNEKDRRVLRFLIPRMDANVVVSEGLKIWLRQDARLDVSRNFSVIYNGVDAKRLAMNASRQSEVNNLSSNENLRDELKLPADAMLCGMVANFNSWKDQLTVCRALPNVFARAPNAHFIFVGGRSTLTPHLFDECVNYCREHNISDRVRFMGKRTDVARILGSLDIFVLSSFLEGLPVALVEAMMMRVPSVVSDIAPLRETVADGRYARIFPTRDHDTLARDLIELLNDADQRRELATRAETWAHEQFGIKTHFARLNQLYADLLRKN
ncbi:MAG: glycosyltransferase [Pyrinomonadaceae bacterium]